MYGYLHYHPIKIELSGHFNFSFSHNKTFASDFSLHWLPVKQQIQFKKLLLTYKSLHTGFSPYLNSVFIPVSSFHSTRCSYPAKQILSIMACKSSHTSKSPLNYGL